MTNTAGVFTNQQVLVIGQSFDTNLCDFTTNYFHGFDVPLALGTNRIAIYAIDLAGNASSNVSTFSFVYPTNPPVISLQWPQNGTRMGTAQFTLRGRVSDATAQIAVQITGGGATNTAEGIVERDGKFWVENLPLASGTNAVSLTVMDIATNTASTNFIVVKSSVGLTITPLDDSVLNNSFVTVTGTIDAGDHTVWVNGVAATSDNGVWTAYQVPLTEGGTAVLQARAIPNSDNGGNGTGGSGGSSSSFDNPGNPSSGNASDAELAQDKPATVVEIHYDKVLHGTYAELVEPWWTDAYEEDILWEWNRPGHWNGYDCYGPPDNKQYDCYEARWPASGLGTNTYGSSTNCGVKDLSNSSAYANPGPRDGEFSEVTGIRTEIYFADSLAPGIRTLKRSAHTKYELRTGGRGMVNQQNLVVLSAGATGIGNPFYPEIDASTPDTYEIASENITLGTLGNLGSDGTLVAVRPNNAMEDVTQRVAGSPYHAASAPTPAKYQLKMFWGTNDITGRTNTVVVGEGLSLESTLRPFDLDMINRLTNFQWTVSGKKIAEFYVSPGQTNGYPVPLTNTTNQSVHYYWYDRGTALNVHCSASVIANGKTNTLNADAYFNVIKPEADWTGVLESQVTVDAGYTYHALHFGWTSTLTNRGIVFKLSNVAMNGYTGAWYFRRFQTGDSDARYNLFATNSGETRVGRGLDSFYPAWSTTYAPAEDPDAPGEPTAGKWKVSREDHLTCHLFFEPDLGAFGDTKPVPVRLIEWTWSGLAVTNGTGSWQLVSTNASIIRNNYPVTEYPSWTNKIQSWTMVSTNWF